MAGHRYDLKDDHFVEEWNAADKGRVVQALRRCLRTGGTVVGAFARSDLVGFASVEGTPFGAKQEYLELSFIHVSCERRKRGIGRRLFELCCEAAKREGARKLYIGAHPSEDTQRFYRSLGCTLATEINEAIHAREPLDIQLEFTV